MLLVLFTLCNQQRSYEKYKNITNSEVDYPIIPLPKKLDIQEERFLLDETTQIVYKNEELERKASYLSGMLKTASNNEISLTNNLEEDKHTIILHLENSLPEE